MKFTLGNERITVDDPYDGTPWVRMSDKVAVVEVEVFDENGHPIGKFDVARDELKHLGLAL